MSVHHKRYTKHRSGGKLCYE